MMKYILCDIEATGNREKDRVIQLGLMIFENDIFNTQPIEIFNELNSTDVPMMSEAMELHNITPEKIKNLKKLQATEAYKEIFRSNLPKNIFISHDVPSDLKMLKKEGFKNQMLTLDTLKCAKHLFPNLNIHRLQFLRYELGLYKDEEKESNLLNIHIKAHDALSDIIITKLLLLKLINEVQKKFNISSEIDAIKKLIDLSSTPVLLSKFKFGKYKGENINDIANSDYRYLEWMRNTLTLDSDMEHTLDYYLEI